jgi:AraC family transcriptional regulator
VAASRRSQAEYTRRMHAVIEHIDRHLAEELDLATLAGVAHFSAFHFHRLFGALTGEVLGDYLRRRRLEVAAVRLRAQLQVPVLQVALGVGFGSAEAFTRAFRARFGCSPTQWRNSKRDQMTRKPRQAAKVAPRKNGGSRKPENAMNVKLIDREPVRVAYLRLTGPYGPPVGRFWMETVAPWMATNKLFGRDRFGISLDDPTVTKPAQCRYDACVESREGEVLSGSPQHKVIPGGRYACLAFEGTSAEIGAAWDALLRDWLPGSGLQLDARPFFEHYPMDGRYDPKTGAFTCNICVPVMPLIEQSARGFRQGS